MTPQEQERYERNLKIYRRAMENPTLTYQEIGSLFGLEKTTTGHIVRNMHRHLNTGEPYFKSRAPKTRKKRGKYKPVKVNQALNPRVKDPEALWREGLIKDARKAGVI